MKVLHIINSLGIGGAEKLLVDALPKYSQEDITVGLLLLNSTQTPFFEQLKGTNGLVIHCLGNISLFNPLLIFRIIPFLRKYEIIHVHLFPAFYWVAIAKILSRSRARFIITIHSISNRRFEFSWITRQVERFMLRRYDKIIAISQEMDSTLRRELHFPETKFHLIENGIDTESFFSATPSSEKFFKKRDIGDRIIIQVSSFRVPKDQPTLIRAMTLLPQKYKLLLVGGGPQKNDCENLAKRLNTQERIKFLGVRTDIASLLKASDVVVLSTGFEGFGLAAVEGLSAGKPVIASDVPGIRSIIGNCGILFPKGDEKTLASYIIRLLSDTEYYSAVAKTCFDQSRNYDIKIMVQRYIKLYKGILKE